MQFDGDEAFRFCKTRILICLIFVQNDEESKTLLLKLFGLGGYF